MYNVMGYFIPALTYLTRLFYRYNDIGLTRFVKVGELEKNISKLIDQTVWKAGNDSYWHGKQWGRFLEKACQRNMSFPPCVDGYLGEGTQQWVEERLLARDTLFQARVKLGEYIEELRRLHEVTGYEEQLRTNVVLAMNIVAVAFAAMMILALCQQCRRAYAAPRQGLR